MPKATNEPNLSTAKIAKLQKRITELEKTLSIIQSGGVDAFVINNEEGAPSIFTLEGADLPYRLLVESLSEGAITVSDNGKIFHCNKQFSIMVSIPTENLIGTLLFDYISKEQHDSLKNLITRGKTESCKSEFILDRADASIKTVLLSCHPLRFGNINGISIVATDISDVKILQQEMNTVNYRYQALMENASCGLLIHDAEGKIFEANKEVEAIFKTDRNTILQKNIKQFFVDEDYGKIDKLLRKISSEKKNITIVAHIRHKSGDLRNIEFSSVHIDLKHKKLYLTIINDTTERDRLREQSLLNDKLAIIGTLAAGVIHEINNPVTWVLANLTYLKKKIHALLSTDNKDIQIIKQFDDIFQETIDGTEKIKEIVKDLKGFARIDESYLKECSDINEILNSAINMTKPQLNKIAHLEKEFSDNIPPILINHSKLHQIFLNLIINAIQSFSESSPNNLIKISTKIENNRVRIDIRDTGKGMPDEIMVRIFDPFFTTKPVGVGTGLGLSICYDLINQEGGEIEVESTPGKGTLFSVYFPLSAPTKSKHDNG
ncbi:MAG: PAS domain S-box protein [Gammaproteobacteria bacterium]|nr:PAS domain S-box protein [Gammaproteobacteria bacterium]